MEHHFNIEYAKEYGIVEAVLIDHFQFWLAKNAANNINFHDGRYWTYNTVQAYADLFPYLTVDKVRRAIEKLVTVGVLQKGNYNKMAMDRTAWYSLRDDMMPKLQSRRNDSAELPNASGGNAEPIPDSETTGTIPFTDVDSSPRNINITSENISTPKESVKKGLDYSFVATEYIQAFGEWLEYKKKMGKMYKTQRGLVRAYNDLLRACDNNPNFALTIVNDCIDKEYAGICLRQQLRQQLYGNSSTKTQQPVNRFQELAKHFPNTGSVY